MILPNLYTVFFIRNKPRQSQCAGGLFFERHGDDRRGHTQRGQLRDRRLLVSRVAQDCREHLLSISRARTE